MLVFPNTSAAIRTIGALLHGTGRNGHTRITITITIRLPCALFLRRLSGGTGRAPVRGDRISGAQGRTKRLL